MASTVLGKRKARTPIELEHDELAELLRKDARPEDIGLRGERAEYWLVRYSVAFNVPVEIKEKKRKKKAQTGLTTHVKKYKYRQTRPTNPPPWPDPWPQRVFDWLKEGTGGGKDALNVLARQLTSMQGSDQPVNNEQLREDRAFLKDEVTLWKLSQKRLKVVKHETTIDRENRIISYFGKVTDLTKDENHDSYDDSATEDENHDSATEDKNHDSDDDSATEDGENWYKRIARDKTLRTRTVKKSKEALKRETENHEAVEAIIKSMEERFEQNKAATADLHSSYDDDETRSGFGEATDPRARGFDAAHRAEPFTTSTIAMAPDKIDYIRVVGNDGALRTTKDVTGTTVGESKYYRVMFTGPRRYGKIFFDSKEIYERWRADDEVEW